MATYYAQSNIKSGGKTTPAGAEVSKSDFEDAEWEALQEAGAVGKTAPASMTEGPSTEMTVADLRERAKDAGIEGYSTMNKADLLKALEAEG